VSANIALVGNPNCGKTTLFNALTGEKQYVGNWPGVTTEKKTGVPKNHSGLLITDLPGLYSLHAYTQEEETAKNYIFSDKCQAVINVVDGVNIERNLYLTLQLIETGKPIVAAINMSDVLEKRGIKTDYKKMSELLGIPIIAVTASKGQGIEALLELAEDLIRNERGEPSCLKKTVVYGAELQSLIENAKRIFSSQNANYALWRAVAFFDTGKDGGYKGNFDILTKQADALAERQNMDTDMLVSDGKYDFITGLLRRVRKGGSSKKNFSKKIDAVVTHRIFAVPIFFAVMLCIFAVSFGPPGQALKNVFGYLYGRLIIDGASALLTKAGVSEMTYGLIIQGILSGAGAVLSFLPEIALLFISLSLLEDSGYMARAAFISDRLLSKSGLSGKSFIPMLMGFGCSVPAIIASRTLENDRQRRLTMMIIPFMSCGARLPIYAVFASVFFPDSVPLIIFSLYLLGIIIAVLSAFILKKPVLKGNKGEFILELPEYRMPSLKNIRIHTLARIKDFALKAGTVIVVSCAAVWLLSNLGTDFKMTGDTGESILAALGRFIAPMFKPLGFDDWRAVTALLSGLTAKEAVVGSLEILFNISTNPTVLTSVFTQQSAYSFLVFTLLYTPCAAALAALKRELKSVGWFLISIAYQLIAAWLTAFLIYNVIGIFKGL
jgi:ferrous iron transport protein B